MAPTAREETLVIVRRAYLVHGDVARLAPLALESQMCDRPYEARTSTGKAILARRSEPQASISSRTWGTAALVNASISRNRTRRGEAKTR